MYINYVYIYTHVYTHTQPNIYIYIYIILLFLTDINECASNPCSNNGTCEDLINSFQCNCTGGYNGTVCETGKFVIRANFKFRNRSEPNLA